MEGAREEGGGVIQWRRQGVIKWREAGRREEE